MAGFRSKENQRLQDDINMALRRPGRRGHRVSPTSDYACLEWMVARKLTRTACASVSALVAGTAVTGGEGPLDGCRPSQPDLPIGGRPPPQPPPTAGDGSSCETFHSWVIARHNSFDCMLQEESPSVTALGP